MKIESHSNLLFGTNLDSLLMIVLTLHFTLTLILTCTLLLLHLHSSYKKILKDNKSILEKAETIDLFTLRLKKEILRNLSRRSSYFFHATQFTANPFSTSLQMHSFITFLDFLLEKVE